MNINTGGWIKIHRKLLDWEWFDDAGTLQLFLHLLLTANYEEKRWRGQVIERGQVVTGLESLANQLKTTVKKVRIRLERLQKSQAIELQPTNKFTIVTICNYEEYQGEDMDILPEGRSEKGKQKAREKASKRANKKHPESLDVEREVEDEKNKKGKQKGKQIFANRANKGQQHKNIRSKEYILSSSSSARAREENEEKGENIFLENEGGEAPSVNTSQERKEKEKSCAKKEKENELHDFEELQQHNRKLVEAMKQNASWVEQVAILLNTTPEKVRSEMDKFLIVCNTSYKKLNIGQLHGNYRSWLSQELRHQQRATASTPRRNSTAQRREMQKRVNKRWEGVDSSKYAQTDEYQKLLEELNQGKKIRATQIQNIKDG